MSATFGKEIQFGGDGGVMTTDPDLYYDQTTQILYTPNLTAGNLVFSGETLTDLSTGGTTTIGASSADALVINSTTSIATVTTLATTTKLQFRDTGLFINSPSDGKLLISSDGVGADDISLTGSTTFTGAMQITGAITVGVDGTGHDLLLYGNTSGQSWLWDESADKIIATCESQFTGIVKVGVDDTGHDVTFYGATSGSRLVFDESEDEILFTALKFTHTGNTTHTGTFGVTGATTIVGNSTLTGTFGITGNSTVTGTFGVSGATTVTSASATSLTVGRLGATTPAFTVDSSTASQTAGLKVVGAATAGTVAIVATDSGSNTNITINAKGSGTIGIGSASTGVVTITPKLSFGLNGGAASASGILMGVGTSLAPATSSTASAIFAEFRTQASATSGTSQGLYWRHDISGIGGSGNAIAARAKVSAACGTVRGAHLALDLADAGTLSGFGAAVDAQVMLGTAAYSTTATCLNAELYGNTGATITAKTSMIRGAISGNATAVANINANAFFLDLKEVTASAAGFIDTDITALTGYGALKVMCPDGVTRYIPITTGS